MNDRPWILVAALVAILVAGACDTREGREASRHAAAVAAGDDGPADLFHPTVTFHRRYGGSKWRLDRDHVFTIKDESHVRATVELENLRTDRTYSVHLVWIRPDGKEMFRRYAEVTRREVGLPAGVRPDSAGALPAEAAADLQERYGTKRGARIADRLAGAPDAVVPVTEIVYKKAIDLGYARRSFSLERDPVCTLESRLNISREKQRAVGLYALRVYLDRRLLTEESFTVQERS